MDKILGIGKYLADWMNLPYNPNISHQSYLWSYMSRRVKAAKGDDISWETDEELANLYLSLKDNEAGRREELMPYIFEFLGIEYLV